MREGERKAAILQARAERLGQPMHVHTCASSHACGMCTACVQERAELLEERAASAEAEGGALRERVSELERALRHAEQSAKPEREEGRPAAGAAQSSAVTQRGRLEAAMRAAREATERAVTAEAHEAALAEKLTSAEVQSHSSSPACMLTAHAYT